MVLPQDVRITTRYNEHEFISFTMAICHETGHARYEQGLPLQWLDQPVGHALGMAVHESQSLLLKCKPVAAWNLCIFCHHCSENTLIGRKKFIPRKSLRLYTRVKPSLIRVDAGRSNLSSTYYFTL